MALRRERQQDGGPRMGTWCWLWRGECYRVGGDECRWVARAGWKDFSVEQELWAGEVSMRQYGLDGNNPF